MTYPTAIALLPFKCRPYQSKEKVKDQPKSGGNQCPRFCSPKSVPPPALPTSSSALRPCTTSYPGLGELLLLSYKPLKSEDLRPTVASKTKATIENQFQTCTETPY